MNIYHHPSKLNLSFSEITDVVENENVWQFFANVVNDIRGVNQQDILLCVAAVMALLLFSNLQRPGAVTNMKINEYFKGALFKENLCG